MPRLDQELVARGLARSRTQAAKLIAEGRVSRAGAVLTKPAAAVGPEDELLVASTGPDYVSRAGHKLAGALAAFPQVKPQGLRCLDAGASTGGFTDVLLDRGAAQVIAVDVGYGQLVWRLRADDRVRVHDRMNIRTVSPDDLGGTVELTVADLSFISLRTALPALVACTARDGELLPMVKPQFEVGRERLGAGGVVRDPGLRRAALGEVATAARDLGLVLRGAVASPLPGPSGNVEYFLRLACERGLQDVGDAALDRAVAEGPG
jgi:23S rRNA (cytidine1920-2'-O)/16S rRNA (cytidine1409-2'-O)-methyltransferase